MTTTLDGKRVCLICGCGQNTIITRSDLPCLCGCTVCAYVERRKVDIAPYRNQPSLDRRKRFAEAPKENGTHKFTSGATSSELKPDYTTIPTCALRREAAVFAYGTERHGRGNYKRGFSDKQFLIDRYNHALDHLFKLKDGVQGEDHLAAVRWFTAFAMEAEQSGVNWHETLRVEVPGVLPELKINEQAKEELRSRIGK